MSASLTQSTGVPSTASRRGRELLHAQRAMQGERVAHRALRPIGRHGENIAGIAQTILERDKTFRLDAVVVGEQDDHEAILTKKRVADKQTMPAPIRLVSLPEPKV